jgi:hypothetical protein
MTMSDNGHRVLEFEKPERCPCCGQVIREKPSDDPIRDEIEDILRRVGGHVPMREILRVLPFTITRWPVYDRLKAMEADGVVRRDPKHPRSGWHYVPVGQRTQVLEMAA